MREQIQKKREEGFTLIELLIVIVILAILAAIVVFAVGSTTQNAHASACKAQVASAQTAVEAYKAQQDKFPATLTVLTNTAADLQNPAVTDGPWLRTDPTVGLPTGYSITYNSPTGTVTGAGPDGC